MKHILKYNPKNLIIDLSPMCNQQCYFCWRNNKPDALEKHNASHAKVMPLDKFKRIVDQVIEYSNVEWVSVCGPVGEPFAIQNLVEYVEYLSGKNFFKTITVNTNGSLINRHDFGRLLNSFTDISFSVDTVDCETYKKIHGKDHLEIVLNNIESLLAYRSQNGGKANIAVRFTECDLNAGQYPEFEKYFRNKADWINYTKIHNFAGAINKYRSKIGSYFCDQSFNVINFNYLGELFTCCVNWEGKPSFGTLENRTLKEAWESKEMELWRNNRHKSICHACSGLGYLAQKLTTVPKPLTFKYLLLKMFPDTLTYNSRLKIVEDLIRNAN